MTSDFATFVADGTLRDSVFHGPAVFQTGAGSTQHVHLPPTVQQPVVWPQQLGTVPEVATAFHARADVRAQVDLAWSSCKAVVLTGGGGVGKTQLAADCAHQARAENIQLLVWADARETRSIIELYGRACQRLQLPGTTAQDAESDARLFLEWLAITDKTWLVVLDDITDPHQLAPWWPPSSSSGRVLATTRRRDALLHGSGRVMAVVDAYTPEEASAFLHDRLTHASAAYLIDDQADALIATLGQLPLAMAHATAYMISEDVSCAHYLQRYTDKRTRLHSLLPHRADTEGYGQDVAAGLLLNLEAVRAHAPAGLTDPILHIVSLLDPVGHPGSLWSTAAIIDYLTHHRAMQQAGSPSVDRPKDGLTAEQTHVVLRLLHRYGLIVYNTYDEYRTVRINALTARAARETITDIELDGLVTAAADALQQIWPDRDHINFSLTAVLRANTDCVQHHAGDLLWSTDGHPVLYTAGVSLLDAGLYADAITHFSHLAQTAERSLGHTHVATLAAHNRLALAYGRMGRTAEAISLQEQSLEVSEQLHGMDHAETLTARNNLAVYYGDAGRIDEAIVLQERVFADCERLWGDDQISVLAARHNLGTLYGQAGRFKEAIVLQERHIADEERLLGAEHPGLLTSRHNLACFYFQAGQINEAISLQEQTLRASEGLFGPDHPSTLTFRNNLAVSYEKAGRPTEAITLAERVLQVSGQRLTPDHSLAARHILAACYEQQGLTHKAINLAQEILETREHLSGRDHPDTLAILSLLAIAYWKVGRTSEAISLQEQILASREQSLGGDHPHTLLARHNLAASYEQAGRLDEAITLQEQLIEVSERLLGPHHPDVLTMNGNLSLFYQGVGRLDDAVALQEQVLELSERVLGPHHPNVLMDQNNLAFLYGESGRLNDAIPLQEQALDSSQRVQGHDHPDTLVIRHNLALSYGEAGYIKKSIALQAEILKASKRVLGPQHPDTLERVTALEQ
ncbi:tetratricopeptide repeat protein [Streptomyces sp. NPDC056486]|uniref:tetratricopeptide repeat protein n=1 Tax=Streptomyces sp. NPDC056486 TaxID=3345835 RepID=UPI003678CAFC